MSFDKRLLANCLMGLSLVVALAIPAGAAPSGPPVRIGSTLSLTGPLAQTGLIHKIAGELSVEQMNKKNGLLGRPVQWILLDDQSKPDQARALYERLITVDKVDLILGPYATANILSAIAVAQRYQKLLISHTFGVPKLSTYEGHFPSQAVGYEPEKTFPTKLFDALASTGKPPKTLAIVTSKFPSVHFISAGARELAPSRGINVVLYLEYEFGNRDFSAIAARIKEANPDFLWVGDLGVAGNLLLDALKKIDYVPKGHYYLFPAPGPMLQMPEAKLAMAITVFEEHPPFTDNPVNAELAKLYNERAAKAGLPYPRIDTQASNSFSAWQILEAAVNGAKTLDDKVLIRWLKTNRVTTLFGSMRFDGPHNFGDDLNKIKQVQDGRWLVVWPKEWAAPVTKIIYPAP